MVSERERAYMRRIGDLKAASHQSAQEQHRSLDLAERLRRSWHLYETYRDDVDLQRRVDDPRPFYDRARALGLYRPSGAGEQ